MSRYLLLTLWFLLGISIVTAQTDCPALVADALTAASENCEFLGRNTACYANVLLNATPRTESADFHFESPGDVTALADLQTLQLSSRVAESGEWGIALLAAQANLPDTLPGQNVTIILFGEVEIENAVEPAVEIAVNPVTNVNIRRQPTVNTSNVLHSAAPDETLTVDGQTTAGDWLRVRLDGQVGWVSADLVVPVGEADLTTLPVIENPRYGAFTPMQAFYFKTGFGDRPCAEAPDSGILIQTPGNIQQKIHLSINGVDLELGSTAYIQADGDSVIVYLLEGSANVEAQSVTQFVPAGTYVNVPLSADGRSPDGAPSFPEPYDLENLRTLPLVLLPRFIELARPRRVEIVPTQEATTVPDAPDVVETPVVAVTDVVVVEPPTPPPPPTADDQSTMAGVGPAGVCSLEGKEPASFTLINNTNAALNVYWVDYNCGEVFYYTLPPNSSYVQPTWVTHPWHIRSADNSRILTAFVVKDASPLTIAVP